MKTPIYDFVKRYSEQNFVRLHMPGHKGNGVLGVEGFDITEILGADDLSCPCGIIEESERNATTLFGTGKTLYSTEGSTAVIKTMLALVTFNSGKNRKILAARNAHKAFLYAAALLDLDVEWMVDSTAKSLCSFSLEADTLKRYLEANSQVAAVYVTSPDYLGNMLDISNLAEVCKQYKVPLLVDNAHGAYLKFLGSGLHPIEQGATMCCDSAHKTLPVLTGGAYLHISKEADVEFLQRARSVMAAFVSTSPSYLILQSLDLCNRYIAEGFCQRLSKTVEKVAALKENLLKRGISVVGNEPLKLTVDCYSFRSDGFTVGSKLRGCFIEPEYCDGRYVVMMFSGNNRDTDFEKVSEAFDLIEIKTARAEEALEIPLPQPEMSIRQAVFSSAENVPIENALGRVCAIPAVSCPPAVPIVISGEVITEAHIKLFKYYGIKTVDVVVSGVDKDIG